MVQGKTRATAALIQKDCIVFPWGLQAERLNTDVQSAMNKMMSLRMLLPFTNVSLSDLARGSKPSPATFRSGFVKRHDEKHSLRLF